MPFRPAGSRTSGASQARGSSSAEIGLAGHGRQMRSLVAEGSGDAQRRLRSEETAKTVRGAGTPGGGDQFRRRRGREDRRRWGTSGWALSWHLSMVRAEVPVHHKYGRGLRQRHHAHTKVTLPTRATSVPLPSVLAGLQRTPTDKAVAAITCAHPYPPR